MITWSESELEQLEGLDFLLKRRNHGSLSVIQYHTISQGLEAVAWLKAKRPELHFSELNLTKRRVNSLELELRTFLKGSEEVEPTSEVVVVRGLEFSLFKIEKDEFVKTDLLSTINFERDLIFRSYGCHFIFLFENEFIKQLQMYAFDFYDWINSWVFLNKIDFEISKKLLINLYNLSSKDKISAFMTMANIFTSHKYIREDIIKLFESRLNSNSHGMQLFDLLWSINYAFDLSGNHDKKADRLIYFLKRKTGWDGNLANLDEKTSHLYKNSTIEKSLFIYFYIFIFIKIKNKETITFSHLHHLTDLAAKSNSLELTLDISTNIYRCQLSTGKIAEPITELMRVLDKMDNNPSSIKLKNDIIKEYQKHIP